MTRGVLRYEERLHVPWPWWVLPALWLATLWIAFAFAAGALLAWAVTALVGGAFFAALAAYGSARVRVSDEALSAGRATLPLHRVGQVAVLDADRARRLRGPEADARAYLFLRAYARGAVAVEVTRDSRAPLPWPYWYVSTRHPDRLAAALATVRDGESLPRT